MTNRIGYLVSSIKLRLAGDLLPVLERSLGRAADFIGRNAGKIADALESGLNWLFTEAPPLAMRFAAAMLRAFGSLLDGISSLAGGLSQNLPALLTGLDIFLNALGQIPAFVVGVGAAIMQGASNLWEEFRSSVVGRLVLPRSSSDAAPATTPETTPVERRRAAIAGVMGMPGMELPGLSHRMGLAGTDSALPSARSGGRSSALADFFKYVGGGAALGAGVGFGVGSIVPGIGNVTGAGVGAGVGAVAGFSYWFGKHVLHRLAAPDAGRGLLPGSPLPAGSERSVRDVFFAQPGRTATDAYFDAFNAMHGKTGNWAMSKDAGLQARLSGFLQSVEKNAGAGSKWAFGAADSLDKAATDYAKQAAISERNARAAERTANATERIAASNQGLLQNFGAMAQGMIVTVAAQITEDMVSAAYRNG